MFPNNIEPFATEINEVMELLGRLVTPVDHVYHVRREDEGSAITFEVSEHLSVAQELAEIDVEQMARLFNHDVVVVAVTDAQEVGYNAVTCTRA